MTEVASRLSPALPAGANVALFVYEKAKRPAGAPVFGNAADRALALAMEDGFAGRSGQVIAIRADGKNVARFLFVGLGPEGKATLDGLRRGAAAAARHLQQIGGSVLAIRPAPLGAPAALAQAVVEGVLLGTYRYTEYQSAKRDTNGVRSLFVVAKDSEERTTFEKGIRVGRAAGEAVTFVRNLVNRPPSDTTPAALVAIAKREVARSGVRLRVYDRAAIQRLGMGALLGVARGSSEPPYFLHFTYRPSKGRVRRRIGICGKGITFDSGGLSLKPAASMETMKYDMTGAATVFGLFRALAVLRPPVEVHGFTPLTENMPGGSAQKPGDVLRTITGKTIEVLNTDAEGRLILADALGYAGKQPIDEVIDIATLTGACVVALGKQIVGLMGTDAEFTARIQAAAQNAGEKMWELPLEADYLPLLKSPVADLKNIGPAGEAGTIMAGLFLKEFVKDGLPWVHLDIASTGWTSSTTALSEVGATGVMVRTLLTYLLSYN